MIEDWIARGWDNFLARSSGPMKFRFVFQPLMALLLALRAGWRDARAGRPPFLWRYVTRPEERRGLLREALRDVRNVFILAVALDLVYQWVVLSSFYVLELVFTSTLLAFVPYLLFRGPANRVAQLLLPAKPPGGKV